MKYSVLYRGSLSSCNYSCGYCPFAKRVDSPEQLRRDRESLQRFVRWLSGEAGDRWKILFTPWGEALIRPWYREAMISLSHLPHVDRVTAQTNLSCPLSWIQRCAPARVSLWATYHPTEVQADVFAAKVHDLNRRGVLLSVGMVAIPGKLDEVESMRDRLPSSVYMWLNAQQPRARSYTEAEVTRYCKIDPHFQVTLYPERSRGELCPAGEKVFTVDEVGNMRRCHFVDQVIGNIFNSDWRSALYLRPCPKANCNCYLGLAQLRSNKLEPYFGDRLLERVANDYQWSGRPAGINDVITH